MAARTEKKPARSGRATPKKLTAPTEIAIDLDAISWDDIELLEEQDVFLEDMMDEKSGKLRARGIKACIWLELRKTRPEVTLAEVGKLSFTKTQLKAAGAASPT